MGNMTLNTLWISEYFIPVEEWANTGRSNELQTKKP